MRYRNNGQGEDNILQNQFTTYLVTAIRWQKIAYLKKRTKLGTHNSLPTLTVLSRRCWRHRGRVLLPWSSRCWTA